jgi:hypothetical protein
MQFKYVVNFVQKMINKYDHVSQLINHPPNIIGCSITHDIYSAYFPMTVCNITIFHFHENVLLFEELDPRHEI